MRVFVVLAFAKALLLSTSCKTETYTLEKTVYQQEQIDSTEATVSTFERFIAPYKERLDQEMNDPLSFNPAAMYKNDTPLNTRLGNLMAGIVREQATAVVKSRTGNDIDMVLLNHGGIRAGIDAGYVTTRTAYEVMPFDNEIVVAQLQPQQMRELVAYLVERKKAHPIDGLKITMDGDTAIEILLDGKPIAYDRDYYVATSDYLLTGGDNMEFFTKAVASYKTDYKIRNAMIDYFKMTDTLGYKADDRFAQKNTP
ncbi:hypothetical protein EJ995_07125 [Nonlabens ponticola]|uniref:5'-Nucleotidase C-terminal domain-containing protein n=2 Tax=Nonlabens ponticola TaxID=2496866 RepID=A0A3S9N1B1_9FLAO|nr:hypothetical protein EJ995_07125 [Nonlabens ponticola]